MHASGRALLNLYDRKARSTPGTEGKWPSAAAPNPQLPRTMRKERRSILLTRHAR